MTAPYTLRPMTVDDEDFVVYSWLHSYSRGSHGISVGAHVPSLVSGESRQPERANWEAYWAAQQPVVVSILRGANTIVACDTSAPHVVWGWACTSGDTVHYVLAKRNAHKAGIGADIYRDLLGARLERACPYTHELVDFKRRELKDGGLYLPRSWWLDSTYFARQQRCAA